MKELVVAIDGPAGAGKSTVAQIVARKLNYTYIDTGAMYRAVTWAALKGSCSSENIEGVTQLLQRMDISLKYTEGQLQVCVNGENVTAAIRTPQISRSVSEYAKLPAVRQAMLIRQRQMADQGGVVMDGRDIGTHVLPDAEVKIFLTASIAERAGRRWRELKGKGFDTDLEQLTHEIAERDRMDSQREIAPLMQAPDAILVDTTGLTIDAVVETILLIYKERKKLV
ncbi:(d)CMP kinase [Acetonema longum]|uniref:Cytidylate kinase n=1 Tax=Acetonema longum DSM 6540 TaxID=1009370 RepID=F7NGC5_9FIRM|nr:(d)CMP kinase [Acetonema longum]EGO64918.1 cytidylate kinase [Acetonema longum DSM 6540]